MNQNLPPQDRIFSYKIGTKAASGLSISERLKLADQLELIVKEIRLSAQIMERCDLTPFLTPASLQAQSPTGGISKHTTQPKKNTLA